MTHFDTVLEQLTVRPASLRDNGGRVFRNGKPTIWTIINRGGKYRAIADVGGLVDDRGSYDMSLELEAVAERIAADETLTHRRTHNDC